MGNSMTELRGVNCYMGSHSVSCHPTQVNTHSKAGTRFTYHGGIEG